MSKLTPKQKAFCEDYLVTSNATESYKRVYKVKKDDTAGAAAARLLRNVRVSEYLRGKQKKLAEKFEISQERVLKEYARIAFGDITRLFNPDGSLRRLNELSPDDAAMLSSVEMESKKDGRKITSVTAKVKVWDKKGALDSICRVLGYNAPEEKKISGSLGFYEFLMQNNTTEE